LPRPRHESAQVERAKGIEPSYAAWEAAVLPLNYARDGLFCIFLGVTLAGTRGHVRPENGGIPRALLEKRRWNRKN
jgi:hypothetical protein